MSQHKLITALRRSIVEFLRTIFFKHKRDIFLQGWMCTCTAILVQRSEILLWRGSCERYRWALFLFTFCYCEMNCIRKYGNYFNQCIKLCCQPVLRTFKDVPFCSYFYHSKKTHSLQKTSLQITWYQKLLYWGHNFSPDTQVSGFSAVSNSSAFHSVREHPACRCRRLWVCAAPRAAEWQRQTPPFPLDACH